MAKKLPKKLSLQSVMQAGVSTKSPAEKNRFDHAEELLTRRPTAYVVTEPSAAKEEGSGSSETSVAFESKISTASSLEIDSSEGVQASRLGSPRFEEVPIELIDVNPYNARQIYLAEKVASLASSMAQSGQLIPGIAVARGERRELIAGHYRRKAAIHAGIKTLKLMVYDNVSDQDLYVLSYKENTEQTEQTPLDNALAWKKLLDHGVFKSEQAIAEAIGMSGSNVNRTLAILKLEPSVLSLVEQAPQQFALSVLYELYLLQGVAGAPVAHDMATRVLENGIGRKEIRQARDRHEMSAGKPSTKRQHESARAYRLWNQDVNIGKIREWDSGKVLVDVTFADQAEKMRFIDNVRALIAQQAVQRSLDSGTGEAGNEEGGAG